MSIRLHIGAIRGNFLCADLNSGQDAANSDSDAHDIPVSEEVSYRPPQSYPGCFGLPYQDHNYGAPPPLSPPPPRSPSPAAPTISESTEVEEEAKVPAVNNEEEVAEDSVTRCICGFLHDDGYMICCDKCSVWQHIDCMEIDRNNIPESYCCEECEPRELDFERARMIQLRRRDEIDTSATDTDPEEPANALASLGRKPVQPKPKGSKQRRVSKAGTRLLKTGRLAKSQQLKRDKKLKLTKKEKENVKESVKKQKIGKTGISKEKKVKKLNISLAQNKADFFAVSDYRGEPKVKENEYSPEILEFLSLVKTNGVHSPHSIGVFPEELLVQLYQVTDVKKNRKGLEATNKIAANRAVIEFRGRVMLRHQYLLEPHINKSQLYVLYYSKFEGLDLCVDASAFGGDARFIRRSCTPNAEMCHIIDNGNLHFIVQAKKDIEKGTEITIPFDFNYQESPTYVECACAKISCPVSKFWKKVKLVQKSPEKTKRKRQASGEGRVRRYSQSKSSPVKVSSSGNKSPVKVSPAKNSTDVPSILAMNESSEAVDVTAPVDSELDFSSLIKPAAVPRRSSRASSDIKEERDIKPARPTQYKESSVKLPAGQENTVVVDTNVTSEASIHPASESEADSAGEGHHRKLTREERKMEAIMKAFEKLEKRQERRKEALARMDRKHTDHIKEEPVERTLGSENYSGNCVECGMDNSNMEQPSQSSLNLTNLSPETDGKNVIKMEDPVATIDSSQKSFRHKRIKRRRRNSRVMSAIEPLYSPPGPQVPLNTDPLQSVDEEMKVKEEPVELPPVSCNLAPSTPVDLTPSNLDEMPSYMFHKKKKHLYNDLWGSRSPEGPMREEEMFVSCTPGPRTSMEHIQRRNSTSATYGRFCDTSLGNAKKIEDFPNLNICAGFGRRCMKPYLSEWRTKTFTRPLSTDSMSPPLPSTPVQSGGPGLSATVTAATMPFSHSPTGSPSDFVTPLKKRRLALEFLPSISSAAHTTHSHDSARRSSTPAEVEPTATSSTIVTPAVDRRLPYDDIHIQPTTQEKRPRIKGTCPWGRRRPKSLLMTSGNPSSVCDEPALGNSASTAQTPVRNVSDTLVDKLSVNSLRTLCSRQTDGFASAGSSASSTEGNFVEGAEISEGSCDSGWARACSSSVVCVVRQVEPDAEMPLVESSDAAVETGMVGECLQETRNGDSLGVCSSNSEVFAVCVHSADSESQEERCFRQDEVVAESSFMASCRRLYPRQDQDEDVSESQPVVQRVDMEEEGNEASVSVKEELKRHSESVSCTVTQPAADCQVNSSQDSLSFNKMAADPSSPNQGEAECRLSSQSVLMLSRTEDSRSVSACASERVGVSSALDRSSVDRERKCVSSAKDISTVSSVLESESLGSSDLECGPSSSTQTSHSKPVDMVEIIVSNSSDVTGSSFISFACEESDVDSTTQNGHVLHSELNQYDTADNHLQAAESEECCDSNSDEQAELGCIGEGGSVSSSGPADSQGDVGADNSHVELVTGNCAALCSTTSVSSSHYSTSRTDTMLGVSISSSVYSSVHLDSTQGKQVTNMLTSTSTLSTTECTDISGSIQPSFHNENVHGPSQSTSQQEHMDVSGPSQSSSPHEHFSGLGQSASHHNLMDISGPSQSSSHQEHISGPSQSSSHQEHISGPSQSSSHHEHVSVLNQSSPHCEQTDVPGTSQSSFHREHMDVSGPSQSSSHHEHVSGPRQCTSQCEHTDVSGPSQSSFHHEYSDVCGPSQPATHHEHTGVSGPSQSSSRHEHIDVFGSSQSSSRHEYTGVSGPSQSSSYHEHVPGPSQSSSHLEHTDVSGPGQSTSRHECSHVSGSSQTTSHCDYVSEPSQSSSHHKHIHVSGSSQSTSYHKETDVSGPSQSSSQSEHADVSGSIQSSSHHSHIQSSDVFSIDPCTASTAPVSERELDSTDTSERCSGIPFPAAEQCEASTSSVSEIHLSEYSDTCIRPVSSSMVQNHNDINLSVSSAGLDTAEDRVVLNGDQSHGGMVSSFSEDSSGSSSTNPSATVSSSEAQAAPVTKRKVSLSEYRNRRKDKTGHVAITSSATSPKSSSDHHILTGGGIVDSCISLAPLPLFEPISIRENRDHKVLTTSDEKEKREKPMSLSDRLRIEFGLETTSEEEEKANSTGSREPSDIPPPPPLPRSGKVGGVGVRRPSCVGGPRTQSTENEEDCQQASSSTFTGSTPSSAPGSTPDTGMGFSNSLAGHAPLRSWLVKLHRRHQASSAVADVTGPSQLQQHPSSSPVFTTSTVAQQRLSQSYNVSGAGCSHLPNGSHASAPTAFSTAALYTASASLGQPRPQIFSVSGKQQQAAAPPPQLNTAYSHYLLQSRTQCLRPQISPAGPRHPSQLGPNVSLSQTQHSSALTLPVGNGVTQTHHAPHVNSPTSHSHGRHHFSQFSLCETVNHKGSYACDRKRN